MGALCLDFGAALRFPLAAWRRLLLSFGQTFGAWEGLRFLTSIDTKRRNGIINIII